MHHLYIKQSIGTETRYRLVEPNIRVFGCNNGIICKQLKTQAIGLTQPCGWQLNLKEYGESVKKEKNLSDGEVVVVIDLKPRARKLYLFELTNIWGYSAAGWTPMMWEVRTIFSDDRPALFKSDTMPPDEYQREKEKWLREFSCKILLEPRIFTFNHTADGTIVDGKIAGKWNPPGPTSLNGCLIWPETMSYFKKFF